MSDPYRQCKRGYRLETFILRLIRSHSSPLGTQFSLYSKSTNIGAVFTIIHSLSCACVRSFGNLWISPKDHPCGARGPSKRHTKQNISQFCLHCRKHLLLAQAFGVECSRLKSTERRHSHPERRPCRQLREALYPQTLPDVS